MSFCAVPLSAQVLHNSPDSLNNTNAISSDVMPESLMYNTIYDMLQTIPGVEVIGSTVKVRGAMTVSDAGVEPLFLLDGVEVSSLQEISPYEVYSIEVVKDGSSVIYGSKAAYGVILFKTKAAHDQEVYERERRKELSAQKEAERKARKEARKAQRDGK